MAWTTETVAETILGNTSTEEFFSAVGPLKSKENALIHMQCDFPGSPTGGAQVNVYKSNDGVVWSTIAEPRRLIISLLASTIEEMFVEVAGTPFFRVGVRSDGADTLDWTFQYARDGGLVAP